MAEGRDIMAGDNWIYTYYQGIKDGTYTVGKWIALIYERIIKDLEEKRYFFDQKKANDAIEWVESHCFHTEGPKAPNYIELEVWQKAMFSCIYGLVDADGHRQYRECVLLVGRKNGKIAAHPFQSGGGNGKTAPPFGDDCIFRRYVRKIAVGGKKHIPAPAPGDGVSLRTERGGGALVFFQRARDIGGKAAFAAEREHVGHAAALDRNARAFGRMHGDHDEESLVFFFERARLPLQE